MTVKVMPLLAWPLTVTVTGPVVAPEGTVTPITPFAQLLTDAGIPLNRTTLLPWVEPKFCPLIVTEVPGAPEETERLLMIGPGVTVNVMPLLLKPPELTVTGPVVAPTGT